MTGVISTYERRLYGTSSEKSHKGKKRSDNDEDLTEGGENNFANSEDELEEEEDGEGTGASKKKSYTHPHKRDYSDIPAEEVIELYPSENEMKGARFVKKTSSYRFLYIPGRLVKIQYDRYIYCKDGHLITPKLPYVPEDLEKRHTTPELIASLLVNKYLYHIQLNARWICLTEGISR